MDSLRAALVRGLYDRFNNADIDGLMAFLDAGVEMEEPLDHTTLRGAEEVRHYWEHVFSLTDHSIAVSDIAEIGDAVFVFTVSQAYDRDEDKPLGQGVVAVHRLTFRGDRITSIGYTSVDEVPEQVRQRLS